MCRVLHSGPWGQGTSLTHSIPQHSPLLVGFLCKSFPPMRYSRLLSQYGAKALDRVLSTILNYTENRVPVPKSYERGEAAFFQGKNIISPRVPAASFWPGQFQGWDV